MSGEKTRHAEKGGLGREVTRHAIWLLSKPVSALSWVPGESHAEPSRGSDCSWEVSQSLRPSAAPCLGSNFSLRVFKAPTLGLPQQGLTFPGLAK